MLEVYGSTFFKVYIVHYATLMSIKLPQPEKTE